MLHPSALRARRSLVGALLAVLAGCNAVPNPSAPGDSRPGVSVSGGNPSTPPSASATPSSGTSPSAAPTELPELAGPAVDSDLDVEDQAAVLELLNSDDLSLYLPSDLIHDGGVILYQTLGLLDQVAKNREAVRAGGLAEPSGAPSAWKRLDVERGGRQAQLRRNLVRTLGDKETKEAKVRVRYPMRGTLVYKDPQRGTLVRKNFGEVFERNFTFQLANNAWKLAAHSPIHIESQGGQSGIVFKQVAMYKGAESTPLFRLTSETQMMNVANEPVLRPADQVRVEVVVEHADANAPYLYAHLVGKNDNNRQALYDDGTHGDKTADDGIYSAALVMPATAGLRHVAIDAVDAQAFTPGGLYRANSVGMSFLVKSE